MSKTSKLTIFEGPDGAGKTQLARRFARDTGAIYCHFGPLPDIHHSLARFYIEAMQPALLGLSDVVFDRSWYSEEPYAHAYRNGILRTKPEDIVMLERVARRCSTSVILCLPSFEICHNNWKKRSNLEYLDNETQLREVYNRYTIMKLGLPTTKFDFTKEKEPIVFRTFPHSTSCLTVGAEIESTKVVIVGEAFGTHKEHDNYYQFPFVSFSDIGCSRWLTRQIIKNGIDERSISWVNVDDTGFTDYIHEISNYGIPIIACGSKVHVQIPCKSFVVEHPSYWLRFHKHEPYKLIQMLKNLP